MERDDQAVTMIREHLAVYGGGNDVPNNNLPLLPPEKGIETMRTLKKAISANKALAELKAAGGLIPNQTILIRAILLQEAKLSSEIENIYTTNDDLYRSFSAEPERTDPATKEVLRYQEAIWHGFGMIQAKKPLSTSMFCELGTIIQMRTTSVRKLPGTRIGNPKTREIIYSPPEGEARIRMLLDNLCEFLQADDEMDPLIKMAAGHYQFEAIHPFHDGNGRTGRVINILYLVERGLLDLPVLYLSRYIIENKRDYYRGLRAVTEDGAWEDWICYMLDGIEETALDTRGRIRLIKESMDAALETAKSLKTRGASKELIEHVFQQPYTRIASLDAAGIARRDAASYYLHDLEQAGLLKRIKRGREVLYINQKLMDILTA